MPISISQPNTDFACTNPMLQSPSPQKAGYDYPTPANIVSNGNAGTRASLSPEKARPPTRIDRDGEPFCKICRLPIPQGILPAALSAPNVPTMSMKSIMEDYDRLIMTHPADLYLKVFRDAQKAMKVSFSP